MPDPTKPLKIKDKKEFEYRNEMYNDSLNAYNGSINTLRDFGLTGTPEDYLSRDGEHLTVPQGTVFSKHGLDVNVLDDDEKKASLGYAPTGNGNGGSIRPETSLDFLGGIGTIELFKKPVQPVEYQKPQRPSYQQIPTKQPNLQSSLLTDEQLTPTYVNNAIEYPKDRQIFTAGNYLKSQGKPSGYVNYGDNKGRKPTFTNGGIHNLNRSNISETFDEMFVNKYK